jgi:hypothetical protein
MDTLELSKARSMTEAAVFRELKIVETPVDASSSSSQRLAPAPAGRLRAGYSTGKKTAEDSQKLGMTSNIDHRLARERRMTAARLSVVSPVFKSESDRSKGNGSDEAKYHIQAAMGQAIRSLCRDVALPEVASRVASLERGGLVGVIYDGVIGCHLVNVLKAATIDFRTVACHAERDVDSIRQNWSLCINSAAAIGVNFQRIDEKILIERRDQETMLETCWALIQHWCLSRLLLSENPRVASLYPGKTLTLIASKRPEKILAKWMHHVSNRASGDLPKQTSRSSTLIVSDLKTLATIAAAISGVNAQEMRSLAACLSAVASATPSLPFNLTEEQLLAVPALGEAWLAVVAGWSLTIDSPKSALSRTFGAVASEVALNKSIKEFTDMEVTGTREERALCAWINSLKINAHVTNLHRDVCDGLVLLHVLERISPGVVDWGKVNLNPRNYFSRTENCNHVVSCCKKLGFSAVGISGAFYRKWSSRISE